MSLNVNSMRNISYICYKCYKCYKCHKLPHPSLLIANKHERELVNGRNMMWNGIEVALLRGTNHNPRLDIQYAKIDFGVEKRVSASDIDIYLHLTVVS